MSLIMSLYLLEGYLTIKKRPLKEQISKEQLLKEQLYEKQTGYKWDRRTKFQIYQDLKKNDNEVAVSVYPSIYKKKIIQFFPYQEFQISRQLIVMKMDITLFIKVIDMDSIIPTKSGILWRLNIF